jgi:hypothetical protein
MNKRGTKIVSNFEFPSPKKLILVQKFKIMELVNALIELI